MKYFKVKKYLNEMFDNLEINLSAYAQNKIDSETYLRIKKEIMTKYVDLIYKIERG